MSRLEPDGEFWRLLVLPALLGIALVAGAGYFFIDDRQYLANASSAPGVVTRMVEESSTDGWVYRPVVRYTTARGESIEFTAESASSPPAYHAGQSVVVLYWPGEAQKARLRGEFGILPLWLGLPGLGLLALAVFRFARRNG